MPIGDFYNAKNVVVGQAVCLLAPANTPLPAMALFQPSVQAGNPFDISPWTRQTLGTSTATTLTLTYTTDLGVTATTSPLTVSGLTNTAIQTALRALANVGASGAYVSGTSPTFFISISQSIEPGVLTVTPAGGTATLSAPLWVPVGATDQGWKFTANKSTSQITIEEQSTSVATTMTTQTVSIEGALSEDIDNTLAVVYNMTQAVTAPATGVPGYATMSLTDVIQKYAIALVMANQLGYPRILYIPDVTSLSNASTTLRRASAKRMYPAVFTSECATNLIQIVDIKQVGS